ncbi:MAG: endolytic transglycosylase MltG, partial [Pseudomonadota bacterium]
EGLTTRQIIARLKEAPMLVGEVTIELKEGDLLPETYSYQRGDNRDSIIERMKEAHDDVLAVLWETRAEGLPLDTPEEAVILASIVEKETGIAAERPRVAGVFINRLNKGMRLQSDPTIIYGLTGGEPLGRGIRLSELRKETPYNTYVIRGLPPTPIANPGRDALAAVLNPLETNDLYFVADGTGGHVFATNLAQHNRNVAKWRRIERERQSQE